MRQPAIDSLRWTSLVPTLLLSLLFGCGGGGGGPVGPGPGPGPGGLPDPGLSNVDTENTAAREATLTDEGGTLSVTGSNGMVYTLTLPPFAVPEDTLIGMYPVTNVTTLPGGETAVAGVHFVPEGLELNLTAKLAITLPAGIDPATLTGAAYEGNGDQLRDDLIVIDGQTITMPVQHFSGKVLGGRRLSDLLQLTGSTFSTRDTTLRQMARAAIEVTGAELIARFNSLLAFWYTDAIRPKFESLPASAGVPRAPYDAAAAACVRAGAEYDAWLDAVLFAQEVTEQPAGTFVPDEMADGETRAGAMLRLMLLASNELCKAEAAAFPAEPVRAVDIAATALTYVHGQVQLWNLATTSANRLGLDELRADLCVRCVVDQVAINDNIRQGVPSDGTLNIRSGYSIDGGPLRFDLPIRVKVISDHDGATLDDQTIDPEGDTTTLITWPNGVNPFTLSIVAGFASGRATLIASPIQTFGVGCSGLLEVGYVTPAGGRPGRTITPEAYVLGDVATYTWNFGGGATPNTSDEATPTITLGNVGTYSASLVVTNYCGNPTTFPFTLTVSHPHFVSVDFIGTVTEQLSGPFPIDCTSPARAYFEYSTLSGIPEFRIEYLEDCFPDRPAGLAVLFLFNQSEVTDTTFATRDTFGSGTGNHEGLDFAYFNDSGNHTVSFSGVAAPEE